jgi:hypothetical protein
MDVSIVMCEIGKLKMLKQVLSRNPNALGHRGITDACLSVDVMLQPLYWYCIANKVDSGMAGVESYQDLALNNFSKDAKNIIFRIYNSVYKLQKGKPERLLSTYCSTLQECFPQYFNNSSFGFV